MTKNRFVAVATFKDNMDHIVFPLITVLNLVEIENKMRLWWNLLKTLHGQYGWNHFSVSSHDQNFLQNCKIQNR